MLSTDRDQIQQLERWQHMVRQRYESGTLSYVVVEPGGGGRQLGRHDVQSAAFYGKSPDLTETQQVVEGVTDWLCEQIGLNRTTTAESRFRVRAYAPGGTQQETVTLTVDADEDAILHAMHVDPHEQVEHAAALEAHAEGVGVSRALDMAHHVNVMALRMLQDARTDSRVARDEMSKLVAETIRLARDVATARDEAADARAADLDRREKALAALEVAGVEETEHNDVLGLIDKMVARFTGTASLPPELVSLIEDPRFREATTRPAFREALADPARRDQLFQMLLALG